MKKCSHVSVCSNPANPSAPIGSSGVPSKQKYAFASESARWYATSRALSSTLSGTTAAPALRMPKYTIVKYGRFGQLSATLSPGDTPRETSRFATWLAAAFTAA